MKFEKVIIVIMIIAIVQSALQSDFKNWKSLNQNLIKGYFFYFQLLKRPFYC